MGEISEHSIEWKYQKKNKNSVAKNDTLILEVYHDADTKWGGWCQQATSDCICFVRKDTLNDGLVDIYVLNYPMLVEWWCSKEIKEKYWGMAIKNDITTVNGIPHHRSSFLPMKVDAIPKEIIIADKRRFDTSVLFKSPRNKLTGWC